MVMLEPPRAGWLVEGLGHGSVSRSESFESLCRYLTPGRQLSRRTLVPWQELFDPSAVEHTLRCRRSIAAADDGGRWVFSQFGEPFDFERPEVYDRPRIRDGFTPTMLEEFLGVLGVPLGQDLDLAGTILIERTGADAGAP